MARPVNADADATRARVLQSALELFSARGAGSTSIREVARAAGVSLAMVHHYYGSKDGLFAACAAAMYDELSALRSELEAALAAGGAVDAVLTRAVVAGFRFALEHRVAVRLLLRSAVDAGEVHPRGREMLLDVIDRASVALGQLLGRPAAALRLPIQSAVFLVARYAVQDEGELALVAGVAASRRKHAAVAAAESHLVDVVGALFAPAGHPRA